MRYFFSFGEASRDDHLTISFAELLNMNWTETACPCPWQAEVRSFRSTSLDSHRLLKVETAIVFDNV